MAQYPLDGPRLPSGSLLSDLVDFTYDSDEPSLNEKQMTRKLNKSRKPIPLRLPQEPLDYAGFNEFIRPPGFAFYDFPNKQPPECNFSPQLEPIQHDCSPQKEQPQGEYIQYKNSQQEEQLQCAAAPQEMISPKNNYRPQQRVRVQPLSVVSNTPQRLFSQKKDSIDVSPTIGIKLVTCGDIPAIKPQTPPPQPEEKRERGKTRPSPPPSVPVERKLECRCSAPGCNRTTLKTYKCDEPLCGGLFASNGALTRHFRCIHSERKHYCCDYCNKPFSRQDHTLRHQKTCRAREVNYITLV